MPHRKCHPEGREGQRQDPQCGLRNELYEQLEARNTTKQPFFKGAACTQSVATVGPQMRIS